MSTSRTGTDSPGREGASGWSRRAWLAGVGPALGWGTLGVGGLALPARVQSQPPIPGRGVTRDLITPETQALIDRSLKHLVSLQLPDGSFADNRQSANIAITGLAGLALMAGGHQPGRGVYGEAVARAAEYVVRRGAANTTKPGYLNNPDFALSHGAMYQHGFGALFLAEVYGMQPDLEKQKRIRVMLERAIGLTRNSQNAEGGWRYDPQPVAIADISVTVAQLMALRAAKNAGIAVPKSVVDKCVNYIKACQLRDGGFCYIKGQIANGPAFARSAAAVVGLYSAGIYEGEAVLNGLRYIAKFTPGRQVNFAEARPEHYYYGHYYAALAMWTAGGNFWQEWFPAIREELLMKFKQDRGFVDWHGTAYATSMALIILQLPNNYLPIMQPQ